MYIEIFPEKYYKQGSQSSREAYVVMIGFYIQCRKVVTSNGGNQKPKHLQNYDKILNMKQHPFLSINFSIAVL